MFCEFYESPIGKIKITCNEEFLLSVSFVNETSINKICKANKICRKTQRQLAEYFLGKRKKFNLPIKLLGTKFQISVWGKLLEIPYGKTVSYSELAKLIGKPKATRAVGLANKTNKIAIIIPCHRVIGKNGKLTGYASGIWRKEFLLDLEKNNLK